MPGPAPRYKAAEAWHLQVQKTGFNVQIIDGAGNTANIVTSDTNACDAVVQIIDTVLMPAGGAGAPAPVRPDHA